MIMPTATDVLATVEVTFETVIRPALTGSAERSAAASISHMLRHVGLRIEREGQVLLDDIFALRPLIADIRSFFQETGEADAARALDSAVAVPERPASVYPSLSSLAEEAGTLGVALESALARLQAMRPRLQDDTRYSQLRSAIRVYLGEQLQREANLIHPAFAGRGPRR